MDSTLSESIIASAELGVGHVEVLSSYKSTDGVPRYTRFDLGLILDSAEVLGKLS